MAITRNHLISLSLGSVGGFVAGAFVAQQWLYGVVGVVMGVWSLLIALVVAPPIISRRSRQAILDGLQDPELTTPIVQSLAAAMASRFDLEMNTATPASEPKPVLAAINRLNAAFRLSVETSIRSQETHLKEQLKESLLEGVEGIVPDEIETRLAAVEEGATRAGMDPKLIQRGRFLLQLGRAFGLTPGRGSGAPAKRKGKTDLGRDGYL